MDRSYFNNRRRKRREKFLELLGGKCDRCGAIDGLHFDHKRPKSKKFNISKRLDAPEKTILKDLAQTNFLKDATENVSLFIEEFYKNLGFEEKFVKGI